MSSTNRQLSNLRKAVANNLTVNHLSKIIQSAAFLGIFFLLLKTGLPLIKRNMRQLLTKSVLIPLGITAAAFPAHAKKYRKILGSGTTTLIISNKEMEYIIKKVKSLEDSGVLIKGVSETMQNETKEQKGGILGMLLSTVDASLLGKMFIEKGVNRAGYGDKGDRITTVGYRTEISSNNKEFETR